MQEIPYLTSPLHGSSFDDRHMRHAGEGNESCVLSHCSCNRTGLVQRRAFILLAVQNQRRTIHRARVVGWIVQEQVGTGLHASPKNRQLSKRRRWKTHRTESTLAGVQQAIERRLNNNGIGMDLFRPNSAKHGCAAHGNPVENHFAIRPRPPDVIDSSRDIARLFQADGRSST